MSFKDRFLEKAWQWVLALPIAILLIAVRHYIGDDGMQKIKPVLTYGGAALMLALFGYMFWLRWQRRQRKLRAAQWKQRIQQIADNTDQPYDIFTFDDFCEFTDDSELERTIEFLEQMPKGQRNVNEAYAKVLAKYGGPI
jgi:hypothetical protein